MCGCCSLRVIPPRCLPPTTAPATTANSPSSASLITAPNWPTNCARCKIPRSPHRSLFPEIESVGGAVAADPPGGRRREMRRQYQRAEGGMLLDKAHAGGARQLRVAAGAGRPFGLQALQRVVQHIADKQRALAARMRVDHDIARRMTRGALEPQPVF